MFSQVCHSFCSRRWGVSQHAMGLKGMYPSIQWGRGVYPTMQWARWGVCLGVSVREGGSARRADVPRFAIERI